MSDAFKPILSKLADGRALTADEARTFFAACLRGETVEEIAAFATEMRAAALKLDLPYEVIDTCGTGGSGLHTFTSRPPRRWCWRARA